MLKRSLGKSDLQASTVVFGAWAIGGWKWGGTNANDSVAAIRAALDAGVNCIDTAPVYGFGLSEELVGEAIKNRPRENLLLATKCGLRWDSESPVLHAESEGKRIFRTLSRDSILHEVEQSLQRLGTDYIDLYQTHWPDPQTPTAEVLHTFNELMQSGKVRAVGFCNSSTDDLAQASNNSGFCTDQEKYNLFDREQDQANLPLVQEKGLGFLAYSPLAQGLLTGAVTPSRQFPDNDLRANQARFSRVSREHVADMLQAVSVVANELDVTVGQLMLAWTLQQPGVSHVLAGTRTTSQAEHNAAAGNLVLPAEALAAVDAAKAQFKGFSND